MDIMQSINVSMDGAKNIVGDMKTNESSDVDAWLGNFDQALALLLKGEQVLNGEQVSGKELSANSLGAESIEGQDGNLLQQGEAVLPFWMLPVDLSSYSLSMQSENNMDLSMSASTSELIDSVDDSHLLDSVGLIDSTKQNLEMQPFSQVSLQMHVLTRDAMGLSGVLEEQSMLDSSRLSKEMLQAIQLQSMQLQEQNHLNAMAEQDVLIDESLDSSVRSGLFNQALSLVVSRSSSENALTSASVGFSEALNIDSNAGQIIEQLSAANSPNLASDEFGQDAESGSLFFNIYQDEVTPSVYDQDWQDVFHSKLLVYVNQKLDQVHIKLHPEEMGPVDVKLSYQQNEAHLSFTVFHAETKEMLLASQEKLKELFQYQGLQLGSFDVHTNQDAPSHQSFSFQQEESQQHSSEEGSDEWLDADSLDEVFGGKLQKPLLVAKGISVWV